MNQWQDFVSENVQALGCVVGPDYLFKLFFIINLIVALQRFL